MPVAQHTPPGDTSFRDSLLRHLGGAAVLIVLVGAVFWALGSLGGADDVTLVSGETPSAAPEPRRTIEPADEATGRELEGDTGVDDPLHDPADEEPADVEATGDDDPAADPDDPADDIDAPAEADAAPAEEDDGEADTDDTDDADDSDDANGDDAESDDETEEPEDTRIDPAEVTVQVLDGFKSDGGRAARTVATTLRDAGYRIIAENPALSYDRTTVLYTAGHEAAAWQVAADIGGAEVRQQSGNLSSDVAVHVVVGADRG